MIAGLYVEVTHELLKHFITQQYCSMSACWFFSCFFLGSLVSPCLLKTIRVGGMAKLLLGVNECVNVCVHWHPIYCVFPTHTRCSQDKSDPVLDEAEE